jgi:hypothetical protein
MTQLREYPNLRFNGLELLEYFYKSQGEFTNIKLTEYIPKVFKFRSLNILKNEVSIFKLMECI